MRKPIKVTDAESEVRIPAWMVPSGWFVVGWSHELASGDVKPLKVFGQELVLYRSTGGELRCLEATCQHLGAHLGYGGKVRRGADRSPPRRTSGLRRQGGR